MAGGQYNHDLGMANSSKVREPTANLNHVTMNVKKGYPLKVLCGGYGNSDVNRPGEHNGKVNSTWVETLTV